MLETQTKTPRDVGLKVARLHVAESGEVRSVFSVYVSECGCRLVGLVGWIITPDRQFSFGSKPSPRKANDRQPPPLKQS